MIDKLKKNRIALVAVVAAIIILVGGAILFLSPKKEVAFDNPADLSEEIMPITAEDLGLEVTVRQDGRAVMFEIGKPKDIERIDYEIRYKKELEGEEVEEGIIGEMNIGEDGITKTDYRTFGTCSSGTCRYDEGVKDVRLVLRVEKADGKIYSLEQNIDLE